ncbi:Glycosyltransferase involved in cell wall bisynthesis [Faecalicatena contorta]|uniref:Glycosyltransferase involved in cell wall bisynthesis n=2 Tax=Faecalicatena contorta TaxID=39482 RepID=A0A315ZUP2_9FIRM|nr:glycosyltransferase involved in cell wall biosynthesis [Faecalicatena contorta]SUQ15387.1 Glycosyltransferase involved in cell wall bisynthesis [Faecalicatena contorta]
MPKISIIVPVYNIKEEYLRKCVESLLQQSLKEIEIIMIDDGSTDISGSICDEYQKKDARIKVIHQENQGVAVARNAGLAIARGEWITFVDADDWCGLDMCEKILERALKLNSDILIFANYAVKEKNVIAKNQFFENDIDEFDGSLKDEAELKTMVRCHPSFSFQPPENMMGGTWCKLINHEFLRKTGILFEPELVRSQDIIFYLNLFERAEKISYYNQQLYYYRYSIESVSKRYRQDAYKIFTIVLQKQDEFIRTHHKSPLFRSVFTKGVMVTIGTCMRTDFMHEENTEGFREKCRRFRTMTRLQPMRDTLKNKDDKTLDSFQKIQKILLKYDLVELYLIVFKINGILLHFLKNAKSA